MLNCEEFSWREFLIKRSFWREPRVERKLWWGKGLKSSESDVPFKKYPMKRKRWLKFQACATSKTLKSLS